MAKNLSDVLTGGLCSGCGACAAMAPDALQMQVTDDGFSRPKVMRPLEAQEHGQIASVCPGIGQRLEPAGRVDHPLWGPYLQAARGHATDPELRHHAASGGALSSFLLSLIESAVVDGAVHVGADPLNPLRNITQVSHNRADLLARAGSRYAPSSPLDGVLALVGTGKTYAFVGKPCDVSALAAWRAQDPAVACSFPVLVSFFCAGVPSLKGAGQVVEAMGLTPHDLRSFAYRGAGWPGAASATAQSGETRQMSYADSWGSILSEHVQHRCKVCADGSGAFADIVFGDAWEADAAGYPSFEDRPGQSAILARTPLGSALLLEAKASGMLDTQPLDLEALAAMQPGQLRRRRVVLARLAGLWAVGRPVPSYRGFGLGRMLRRAGAAELARNFLGTVRRAMALPRKGKRIC